QESAARAGRGLPRRRGPVPRHLAGRLFARSTRTDAAGAEEAGRTVSPVRSGRSGGLPECSGGPGQVLAGVLHRRRYRQRQRLGLLAAGRPVVCLVLPRRAACARVGERGQLTRREAERLTIATSAPTPPRSVASAWQRLR